MAQTTEELKGQISTAEDLQSVVKTMKALSSVNIREYERAVEALAEYNRTIEMGLQVVLSRVGEDFLAQRPEPADRYGAVVFGSEQGMVGQFNEQIAGFAARLMGEIAPPLSSWTVLALGSRVVGRLEDTGASVEEEYRAPASGAGITSVVRQALIRIEDWGRERHIDHVLLFYNEPLTGASYRPRALQLVPVDVEWLHGLATRPWQSRVIPIFSMDWERLFSALIRLHLFAAVYQAFAASLASENASRLASMQAAERNIEERLGELKARYQQERQATVTAEILDIISGFEALTEE